MTKDLIIFCGQYLYILTIVIAVVYFLIIPKDQKKSFALLAISALPCIYLVSRLAANFYFDPRPFVVGHFTPFIPHAPDNGFPSDHALLTSAIASIVFVFNKKLSGLLWLLTIIVSAARVMAGIHHSIDIIGAVVISIVVATWVDLVLKRQKFIYYKH